MAKKSKPKPDYLSTIISYAKTRAETLGDMATFYKEKEKVEGYLVTTDRFIYGMAKAQLDEIERLITFLEGLFPQGNITHITNNEKEDKENVI